MTDSSQARVAVHLSSDPHDTAILQSQLCDAGFRVAVVRVDRAATLRSTLASTPTALLIADLPLPWSGAEEMLQDLRSSTPDLPVVFRWGTPGNRVVEDESTQIRRVVHRALKLGAGGDGQDADQRPAPPGLIALQDALLRFTQLDVWESDGALREITETTAHVVSTNAVSVWEVDASHDALRCLDRFVSAPGEHHSGELLRGFRHHLETVQATGGAVVFDSATGAPPGSLAAEYLARRGIQALLAVTIKSRGEVVGLLFLEHTAGPRRWTPHAHRAAAAIASFAGRVLEMRERRRLEEQLRLSQKLEAVGRLAGGIAHDFNNILTAVIGSAELARLRCADVVDVDEELHRIVAASERGGRLIRQLMAFTRQQLVEPRIIDLGVLVAEILPTLQRLVGEDIAFRLNVVGDAHWMRADPAQIEQILMNLTANARDAMPGGGTLDVAVDQVEDQAPHPGGRERGPWVRLVVLDNGCGMDEATLARVFEPFFTTKEPGKGTGLGLASVYGVVRQCAGHISVRSRPGRGTRFEIHFPRTARPDDVPRAVTPATQSEERTARILLAEDDELTRRTIARTLVAAGYEVVETTNGAAALEICESAGSVFDLLVSDVIMPRMDGITLAERVRQIRPELAVLLTSGFHDHARLQRLIDDGEIPFLPKPFTREMLLRRVREMVRR